MTGGRNTIVLPPVTSLLPEIPLQQSFKALAVPGFVAADLMDDVIVGLRPTEKIHHYDNGWKRFCQGLLGKYRGSIFLTFFVQVWYIINTSI